MGALVLSGCDRSAPPASAPQKAREYKPTKETFARDVFVEIDVKEEKYLLRARLNAEVNLEASSASASLLGSLPTAFEPGGQAAHQATSARAKLQQEAQRVISEAYPGLRSIFVDIRGLFQ